MIIRISHKAIIIKDGKILLNTNKDVKGIFYMLPGGGQEHGETIHKSLERECLEETGLIIKVGELVFVRDYIENNHEFADIGTDAHQVELMFLCEVINDDNFGKVTLFDNWQTGVEWIEIHKLIKCRIYPSILKTLIPSIGKKNRLYIWVM